MSKFEKEQLCLLDLSHHSVKYTSDGDTILPSYAQSEQVNPGLILVKIKRWNPQKQKYFVIPWNREQNIQTVFNGISTGIVCASADEDIPETHWDRGGVYCAEEALDEDNNLESRTL